METWRQTDQHRDWLTDLEDEDIKLNTLTSRARDCEGRTWTKFRSFWRKRYSVVLQRTTMPGLTCRCTQLIKAWWRLSWCQCSRNCMILETLHRISDLGIWFFVVVTLVGWRRTRDKGLTALTPAALAALESQIAESTVQRFCFHRCPQTDTGAWSDSKTEEQKKEWISAGAHHPWAPDICHYLVHVLVVRQHCMTAPGSTELGNHILWHALAGLL